MNFEEFTKKDFSAFVERKQNDKRFDPERRIVREKFKRLKSSLDDELSKIGINLNGHISLSGLNRQITRIDGIWLAYNNASKYFTATQLNFGIYKDGFFAGIEVPASSIEDLDNVYNYIKSNPEEFISFYNKLDKKFRVIDYGDFKIEKINCQKQIFKN